MWAWLSSFPVVAFMERVKTPACPCAWSGQIHSNPHAYAQPICVTVQILTPAPNHRPPFMPTSTHSVFHSLKLKSSCRRWAATVFIRWRPLPLAALVLPRWCPYTKKSSKCHFLRLAFHQYLLLCGHRCPRSYTLCVGADGSYSSPSIRAVRGDHSPLVCTLICMCWLFYIICLYVFMLCSILTLIVMNNADWRLFIVLCGEDPEHMFYIQGSILFNVI